MSQVTKYLIDTMNKNLVLKVMNEFVLSISEAMDVVYPPQTYEKNHDTETGQYFKAHSTTIRYYARNI